jgi:acyl-CoA dehydrogenase
VAANRARGNPWIPTTLVEELKGIARGQGLWNLFLPDSARGAGLTNLEYAPLAEIMGRVTWAPEVFNCNAPDTGNMETIERYGTDEQKRQWLEPLLEGRIRSAFLMTEPAVASSDATNIEARFARDGDDYVINGRKWWSSGRRRSALRALHRHGQDRSRRARRTASNRCCSCPPRRPGIRVCGRSPSSAPTMRRTGTWRSTSSTSACRRRACSRARDAASRSRRDGSGPGRIHHCMRLVGLAERALE